MILVIHAAVTGSDMCPIIQTVVKASAFQHLQGETQHGILKKNFKLTGL